MKVKESKIDVINSLNNLGEKEPIIVFISYTTKDSERFQIPIIAEKLMKYPGIKKVLYWEEHMRDDIIKYMNDNVGKCDILLLFCSPNSLKSEPVEMEWQAA